MNTKTKNYKKKKLITLYALAGIFCILAALCVPISKVIKNIVFNTFNIVYSDGSLLVHYIDVGQADAIAINLPDGKVMLIDAGDNNAKSINNLTDYLDTNVLFNSGSKVIDYFIMTHSDADHIGGAPKVFAKYEVKNCFRPKIYCEYDDEYATGDVKTANSIVYKSTIKSMKQEPNIKILEHTDGYTIKSPLYEINFFVPQLLDSKGVPIKVYSSTNEYSPFIKLSFMEKSFLFTGDAYQSNEGALIEARYEDIDIDVLKVGHHGANTSTGKDFLKMLTPEYAVISVGHNSYGHPTSNTIQSLKAVNSQILRTDKLGSILFIVGDYYGFAHTSGSYSLTIDITYIYYLLGFGGLCIVVLIRAATLYEKSSNKK